MDNYTGISKRLIVATLGLALFFAVIATGIQSPTDTRIAHFEKNQETFVKQVQESDGIYVDDAGVPVFDNQTVFISPPRVESETTSRVSGIEAPSRALDKWIEVDLSDQRLATWLGNQKLKDYPVSTGLPGSPTIKGEFHVWRKVLLQGYRGGSKARGTYYYLPNVPYSLFFHQGYAIHAAYWHNDFGIRPRSHGCVNMRTEDAKQVYEWATPVMPAGLAAFNADAANPGTRIVIHD